MARIDWVDARLRKWGEWMRSEGSSEKGIGYPKRCVLHPDWGAPGTGSTPTLHVERTGEAAFTHYQIRTHLSVTLQQTLTRHYGANETVAQIAAAMGKTRATVDQRIVRCHAVLAHLLR